MWTRVLLIRNVLRQIEEGKRVVTFSLLVARGSRLYFSLIPFENGTRASSRASLRLQTLSSREECFPAYPPTTTTFYLKLSSDTSVLPKYCHISYTATLAM